MKVPAFLSWFPWTALVVGWAFGSLPGWSAEEPANLAAPKPAEAAQTEIVTNTPVEIRVTTQLIEQIRREIEQRSARDAEAITSSLNLIEPALSRMQQRQAEAWQGANSTILIIASVFAAISFMALVVITLILARALGRFSELAAAGPPPRRELGAGNAPSALEPGGPPAPDRAVEQASHRFQGALEQLQRRILELEHGLQGTSGDASRNQIASGSRTSTVQSNGVETPGEAPSSIQPMPPPGEHPASAANESVEPVSRAVVLLGKGQTLLNLGEWKEALACFEQVLAATPNNAEAQVKKGLALEQLENWNEALESYNRALAIDDSLTVAYLYKGAVCNRLQRYQEALASYEQALHTEGKSRAS